MLPSSSCSPSIMVLGSFGLFSANQYYEHLSPSFRKWAWANSFAFEEQKFLVLFSDVALLEEILLLWVSMSLLRPFMCLFAFLLSSSVILMAFSLMSALIFFLFSLWVLPTASESCDFFHAFA